MDSWYSLRALYYGLGQVQMYWWHIHAINLKLCANYGKPDFCTAYTSWTIAAQIRLSISTLMTYTDVKSQQRLLVNCSECENLVIGIVCSIIEKMSKLKISYCDKVTLM